MLRRTPAVVTGVLLAVTIALAAGGCGSSSPEARGGGTPATPTSAPSSSKPAAPWRQIEGPLARCGPQPAAVAATPFHFLRLRQKGFGSIPAVTAGHGRTVAVLLPETDPHGLCGWLVYARTIVSDPDLSVLAIDLCGYGVAHCTHAVDGPAQTKAVSLAIDYAERHLHARRIVVVGASMGGSVALMTAVRDRRVDTAIDLSGPVEWDGMQIVRGGRALPMPVLVAMAQDETDAEVAGARSIAEHAPDGSRFLTAPEGHGWALLNHSDGRPYKLAEPVLDWIRNG